MDAQRRRQLLHAQLGILEMLLEHGGCDFQGGKAVRFVLGRTRPRVLTLELGDLIVKFNVFRFSLTDSKLRFEFLAALLPLLALPFGCVHGGLQCFELLRGCLFVLLRLLQLVMQGLDCILHHLEGVRIQFHTPLVDDLEEIVDLGAIALFLSPVQETQHTACSRLRALHASRSCQLGGVSNLGTCQIYNLRVRASLSPMKPFMENVS